MSAYGNSRDAVPPEFASSVDSVHYSCLNDNSRSFTQIDFFHKAWAIVAPAGSKHADCLSRLASSPTGFTKDHIQYAFTSFPDGDLAASSFDDSILALSLGANNLGHSS